MNAGLALLLPWCRAKRDLPMKAVVPCLLAIALLLLPGQAFAQCVDPVSPGPDWRGSLDYPEDPFLKRSFSDQPSWVKFAIRLCEPGEVLFQDSNLHPFHMTSGPPPWIPTWGSAARTGTPSA